MLSFILQMVVFLSLGLVLYLFARALPRVKDETVPEKPLHPFERMMSKLPLAKIDAAISVGIERVLRKFRVVLMKVDHFMSTHISKVRKSDNNDKPGNPPEQK